MEKREGFEGNTGFSGEGEPESKEEGMIRGPWIQNLKGEKGHGVCREEKEWIWYGGAKEEGVKGGEEPDFQEDSHMNGEKEGEEPEDGEGGSEEEYGNGKDPQET